MRTTLVAALSAYAESRVRARARRFLSGLSADELQFIAEYLGARILQSAGPEFSDRFWPALDAGFSPDRDHKMILLMEYLRRSGGSGDYLTT